MEQTENTVTVVLHYSVTATQVQAQQCIFLPLKYTVQDYMKKKKKTWLWMRANPKPEGFLQ